MDAVTRRQEIEQRMADLTVAHWQALADMEVANLKRLLRLDLESEALLADAREKQALKRAEAERQYAAGLRAITPRKKAT